MVPPIEISFANPISRIGTQIQRDQFGSFSTSIGAFDSIGNALGSFTRNDGNSTSRGDGSAIFIGIGSDTANIARVQFSVPSTQDFAIGSLTTSNEPVPEPLTILGTITAGGMGVAMRLKKKKATKRITLSIIE